MARLRRRAGRRSRAACGIRLVGKGSLVLLLPATKLLRICGFNIPGTVACCVSVQPEHITGDTTEEVYYGLCFSTLHSADSESGRTASSCGRRCRGPKRSALLP